MAERYSSFQPNGTAWLLQRVTAAILVVLLAFHFFQLHFLNHAYEVTFQQTHVRMRDPAYFATMVLFLVTAAFHGVNGIYSALINQGLDGRLQTVVKWGLALATLLLIAQGIRVATAMAGVTIT